MYRRLCVAAALSAALAACSSDKTVDPPTGSDSIPPPPVSQSVSPRTAAADSTALPGGEAR